MAPPKLSPAEIGFITDLAELDPMPLTQTLHFVGDDTVKISIQTDLEQLLDEETYNLVLAVFQVNADEDTRFRLFEYTDPDTSPHG